MNKLEFGTDDGFVAGAELDSSVELSFARFSTYRTIDPELRKNYSEEVFNFIDMLSQKKRRIKAILKAGDFRRDESNFEIPEDSQVLVVAMAEGAKVMHDTALLLRGAKVMWEMEPEKTYHAGGAFKNRIQIEVLALTSGAYKLQFRSDDLHSFDNWNDLPPTYPDLCGVQVFSLSTSEARRIENVLKKHTFSNTLASNSVRAVQVDGNGDLLSPAWEAGQKLLDQTDTWIANTRKIYTIKSGARVEFTKSNITPSLLNVPGDSDRDKLVDFIRGLDAYDEDDDNNTTEKRPWILGDIFHATPAETFRQIPERLNLRVLTYIRI